MMTALGTGLRRAAARLAPDPAPDGELLARFLATRDEAAFALLVRRHAGMVFGTCRRVLGNAADADDAFQAAFVVLVRKAHSLTDRACVGNFLYGVAFHTALKARAMATKRRAKEARVSRPEQADGGELTRVLDDELAKLPDKYREPVVLCELDGVSRKEAAARLGIPEGTVSSRLATAHRMLAKRLSARGFASVAVAAVLGNQAFAVPDVLADAAVRAAVDGSSGAVTQLATEVSKMLLWNKLKAGAVVAGVLLACGVGFGVMAKAFADDKPVAKAPLKEAKKPDDAHLILGKWVQTSLTVEPNKNSLAPLPRQTLTFGRKGLHTDATDERGERLSNDCQYELNPNTTPKELTLSGKDSKSHWIYDLDGNTLKLAVLGDGVRPTSFDPKDIPKGRTMKVIEFTREKVEPKKPDADKSYSLKDGEVLKLIVAPFPEEREEVYKLAAGHTPFAAADDCLMAVTVKDGKPVSANAFTDRKSPGQSAPGKPLVLFVQHALRTDMAKVADPHWLLDTTVLDADVVLKKGADPAELMAALEKELSAKCGAKVTLKFEEVEREVVVVSGKHTLKADPPADPTRPYDTAPVLHLYATDKQEHANGLYTQSDQLAAEIARFVGRPVIDESDLKTKGLPVTVRYHVQSPETDKTRAADRDPAKVLQNLSNQTELVFKQGKQKVKVLVVESVKKGEARTRDATEKYDWQGEPRTREVRTLLLGGEKVELVKVPAGAVTMGSPETDKEADDAEKPLRKVTFTKGLWVAKHAITKGQFAAFVKATGYQTEAESDGKGGEGFNGKAIRPDPKFTWRETGWEQTDAHPVVNVSWNDAAKFCEWAAKESKAAVRLPTEAEYEYAARGGTQTTYPSGDTAANVEGYANVADASGQAKWGGKWAAPFDDGEAFTSPVGKYKPNGFGLYDMAGNVWSWCADWSDAYPRGDATDPQANANGPRKYRVLRGGSWYDPPKGCRAAARSWAAPGGRLHNIGFRVVFAVDATEDPKAKPPEQPNAPKAGPPGKGG